MKPDTRKFRLGIGIVLLLVLLLIVTYSWHLISRQLDYADSQEDKKVSSILNAYKERAKDTASPKPATVMPDSTVQVQKVTDTLSNLAVIPKTARKKHDHIIPPPGRTEINTTSPKESIPAKPNDVAPEKNCRWKILVKDEVLCVYPFQKWKNIIIIHPLASAVRERKMVFHPDFPGVVYISDSSAEITVSGTRYRASIEKFTAAEASSTMPFFISLKRRPEFIIFGANDDPNNWYIYTKNQLSDYTPTVNSDNKSMF